MTIKTWGQWEITHLWKETKAVVGSLKLTLLLLITNVSIVSLIDTIVRTMHTAPSVDRLLRKIASDKYSFKMPKY